MDVITQSFNPLTSLLMKVAMGKICMFLFSWANNNKNESFFSYTPWYRTVLYHPAEKQFFATHSIFAKQVTAYSNSCLQQLPSMTTATPYHKNNWNYKQWWTGRHTLVHIGVCRSHRWTNGRHGSEFMCGFIVSLSQKAYFLLTGCAMMTTLINNVYVLTLGPHVKFGDDL